MLRKTSLAAAAALSVLSAAPALAHFQLIYTPEVNLAAPPVEVKLIFWHPLSFGHVMDMGMPEQFFYVHNGERTDLLSTLQPITFTGGGNSAAAFQADLLLRTAGDYILSLVPAPYYEEAEDIYIQQVTKMYLNRGGLPTDWDQPVGLPTEIVPLEKPTNILVGSTFTGRLLSNGEPVPNATLEVEYIAAPPDMATNTATAPTAAEPPGGTINVVTDVNGYFTFGIPRSGFWGFAALGVGPETEYMGKHLSQDAVIWVYAYDFGGAPGA